MSSTQLVKIINARHIIILVISSVHLYQVGIISMFVRFGLYEFGIADTFLRFCILVYLATGYQNPRF
jgi:hypothetical protein